MKETTKCTTGANTQIIIIAIIELVLSISQLVTSIIGTIIVTQIKPWKKFKVRLLFNRIKSYFFDDMILCGQFIDINTWFRYESEPHMIVFVRSNCHADAEERPKLVKMISTLSSPV